MAAVLLVAGLLAGCATREPPATVEPGVAAAAIEGTAPDRPLRVVFDWSIRDGEARFTGSGVARTEPPYRARLDLFGPRGETYLSAALVGTRLRLPPGLPALPLPPPALMWAVLGAVVPPDGAVLTGTRVEEARTELHYAVDGDRIVYRLEAGRLRSVDWTGSRRLAVRVGEPGAAGVPSSAVYRDASGNTELELELESADEVESFPPEVWIPDA